MPRWHRGSTPSGSGGSATMAAAGAQRQTQLMSRTIIGSGDVHRECWQTGPEASDVVADDSLQQFGTNLHADPDPLRFRQMLQLP